jgi:hypothetical protein
MQLQQGFAAGETGLRHQLRNTDSGPPGAMLGQFACAKKGEIAFYNCNGVLRQLQGEQNRLHHWSCVGIARERLCPRVTRIARPTSEGRQTDMKKNGSQKSKSPAALIDARIKELGDWRGQMLSRLRGLVKEADPEVVEEWKWRGVPVWSHDGLICTGETYKNVVKMTFAKGAALADPSRLFNASLEGNTRRAIDFREGDAIDEGALKALIRAAVTLNKSKQKR